MKIFIEAIEQTDAETSDFIQEEVKGNDTDTIKSVLSKLQPEKTYKLRRHQCKHDEDPVKPCIATNLTEDELAEAVK